MGTQGRFISTIERELIRQKEKNISEYHNGGFRENPDRSHDVSSTSTYRDNTPNTHKCNGGISNQSFFSQSKPSLNLSRRSLGNLSRASVSDNDYGTTNALASLGLIAVLALIVASLALQLTYRLNVIQRDIQSTGRVNNLTIFTPTIYRNVLEATVAVTTFVVMLNLSCLLVASTQFFYAAKILKLSQGDERAFKYLTDCSSSRFIAVSGFFISIPALMVGIILYILMEFLAMTAIISASILALGAILSVASLCHSTYHWNQQRTAPRKTPSNNTKSELSTLV